MRIRAMVLQPVVLVAAILLGVVTLSGCGTPAESAPAQTVPNGDSSQGASAIRYYGCGSCHTIPGINGANGNVGPPLNRIGTREYIAGKLQNNPNNLMYWIINPQKVWPGVDMPDMHVTHRDARNIAAYLYTLR